MFHTVRLNIAVIVAVATTALAAPSGSFSVAGEPQEKVLVRQQPGHTIQILHVDGTTTKILPTGQFLQDTRDAMAVTAAEATANAEKENAKRQPNVTAEMHIVRRGAEQTVKILHHDGTMTTFAPPAEPTANAEKENAKQSPSTTGEPQDTVANRQGPEQTVENIYGDGRRETVKVGAKRSPSITGDAQDIAVVRRLTDRAIEIIYADGAKETITIQRNLADQTTAILNVEGTTTKLPPGSRAFPASSKHASVSETAAETENDNVKGTATAGRFQISPAGDSAILVDTETGKSWLLYYPDKKIPSRLSEARGKTWGEMPCIWLPLHRPETDAEIEQILARERALREVSDKLRAEEQTKAEAEAKKRAEEFEKRSERKRPAGSGGTRRNADGTPQEPKSE